ncbi:MAG: response regulator transcription factor [Actinomycetota bacterium]
MYPAGLVTIRVLLAEDSYLVREGVRGLLDAQPDIDVVDACADLDGLLAGVKAHSPDVVVTDIRMPPDNSDEGIRAAATLRETNPDLGVVVLSQYDEPEYALALLERGSQGRAYLLKQRVGDIDHLVAAIREVAAGGSVIDPKVVEGLVAARTKAARSPLGSLTPREREVLGHMAQGKNNAAIAAALFLTERAIERHINSMFSKLGLSEEKDVHRRVKAVLLFLADRSE